VKGEGGETWEIKVRKTKRRVRNRTSKNGNKRKRRNRRSNRKDRDGSIDCIFAEQPNTKEKRCQKEE
jgi:hypothetical protein